MPTRREILLGFGIARLATAAPRRDTTSPCTEIREEPHALSQESASGFRLLLQDEQSGAQSARAASHQQVLVIAPGIRYLTGAQAWELKRRAEAGSWLILETGVAFSSDEGAHQQADLLASVFAIKLLPALARSRTDPNKISYVCYSWPLQQMVRTFEAATPLLCQPHESIAAFDGQTVCARKTIGTGGVVYLGSMLGAGLLAREREAHAVGASLLRSLHASMQPDHRLDNLSSSYTS